MRVSLSTLLWLVFFIFFILLVSIFTALLIWQGMVTWGVLPPLTAGTPLTTLLFVWLVSLFIGTSIAIIGGDYLLRPLHRLTESTKEIAAGNFNVRVDIKGSQELVKLADSFNEMAKELSSIETLRADFVSTISHEYKTPVASIQGFAKRLLKGNLSEEKQREYLNIIVSESERLSRLSSNVLLLSKLESSKWNTERAEYSLDEQLRMVIMLLEPQFQRKNLKVDINLEETRITANEETLRQLWINLLGNAIKFNKLNGSVSILLKNNNTKATVSITDTGIGMSQEQRTRIFEKFFQGDSSRGTEGNGLGLSLVKRILELEGGNINVESKEGEGTCFIVELII